MNVTTATARRFSADLLRIHAAATPGEVESALRRARGRPGTPGWIDTLLGEHGEIRRTQLSALRPVYPGAHECLTPREREVLQRLVLGDTDAAASRALGIATKTVSKHVENILRKLGVENRTAAAARAVTPAPTR